MISGYLSRQVSRFSFPHKIGQFIVALPVKVPRRILLLVLLKFRDQFTDTGWRKIHHRFLMYLKGRANNKQYYRKKKVRFYDLSGGYSLQMQIFKFYRPLQHKWKSQTL